MASAAQGAAGRDLTYPLDVLESVWWAPLPSGEPALWPPEARAGYRSRMRLAISGISMRQVVIRIDERDDGRISGRALVVDRRDPGGGEAGARITISHFRPSTQQMATLRERIVEARLWTLYPEHWVNSDGNSVCIDGEQLVFERADSNGYRFSEANAQCTAPSAVLNVAREMIRIAQIPIAERLLR